MKNYVEMAIKSVEARGMPYYEGLNKQYSIHYASFCRMHGRIEECKLITDFPRTYKGFKDFIDYIGDIPIGMKKPSVGRYDHSKGYIKGNFRWQELSENTSEVIQRIPELKNNFLLSKNKRLYCSLVGLINKIPPGKHLIDNAFLTLTGYYKCSNLYKALRKFDNIKLVVEGRNYYLVK